MAPRRQSGASATRSPASSWACCSSNCSVRSTRARSTYAAGAPLDDPQGAIAFLPAFQVGLYLALWVAAFVALGWRRFLAGLAVLGVTQTAGLLALHALTSHSGLTAHVRDVRGWAVAGPLLICRRGGQRCPGASLKSSRSRHWPRSSPWSIAAPVLRAPSERLFGMEIVGRHHDPFTVMEQFGRPIAVGVYSQPVTDITGALLARISGAVAAYNWLVLLSFPLSAAAAYLLARHLALSPAGATVAAMAFAFSPFHVAHAAYHPHIAQTQWVPLYLLALWRCLDNASPAAVGFLGAATIAVTLSNFYGGLIAAVITPVAVAAYWLRRPAAGRTTPAIDCAGLASRSGVSRSSPLPGSRTRAYAAGAVVVEPRRPSRSLAPICSATARNGGAIWCRRSSIRCSARPRIASGRRRASARGCSNSR